MLETYLKKVYDKKGLIFLQVHLGQATGTNVSGVAQTFFQRMAATAAAKIYLLAAAGVGS